MRTTVTLDDDLLARAEELTGISERSALIRDAVELLVRIESGRQLAALGGSDQAAEAAPRIDHLRQTEPVLVDLLERDQVCVHQSVITELALGNLRNRSIFLKALERLMIVRNVDDQGVRHLVEERRLWGRGLSAVDAALLASVVVTPGVSLWTRDKRLRQAARDVGVLANLD